MADRFTEEAERAIEATCIARDVAVADLDALLTGDGS